jgi:hypothetical protein
MAFHATLFLELIRTRFLDWQATEDTYLYRFDDIPMLKGYGIYRNNAEDFLERVE